MLSRFQGTVEAFMLENASELIDPKPTTETCHQVVPHLHVY